MKRILALCLITLMFLTSFPLNGLTFAEAPDPPLPQTASDPPEQVMQTDEATLETEENKSPETDKLKPKEETKPPPAETPESVVPEPVEEPVTEGLQTTEPAAPAVEKEVDLPVKAMQAGETITPLAVGELYDVTFNFSLPILANDGSLRISGGEYEETFSLSGDSIRVSLPDGSYSYTYTSNRYYTENTQDFSVSGTGESIEIGIEDLAIYMVSFELPPGLESTFNDNCLGAERDPGGLYPLDGYNYVYLPNGQYSVSYAFTGYEPGTVFFEVSGSYKTVTIEPVVASSTISLDIRPEGARSNFTLGFYQGDELVKEIADDTTVTLTDGSYTYKYSHPQYAPVSGGLEVSGDDTLLIETTMRNAVHFVFTPITYTNLMITISNASESYFQELTTETTAYLSAGNYQYSIRADGFMPINRVAFTVEEGSEKTIEITLQSSYTVRFETSPAEAMANADIMIYQNGEWIANVYEGGVSLIPSQYSYTYVDLNSQYKTETGTFTVLDTATEQVVTIPCVRVYTVQVSTNVEGALLEAFVDFSQSGLLAATSYNGGNVMLPPGEYQYRYSNTGFTDVQGTIQVSSDMTLTIDPLKKTQVNFTSDPAEISGQVQLLLYDAESQFMYSTQIKTIYLLPGDYSYQLFSADYQPASASFTVGTEVLNVTVPCIFHQAYPLTVTFSQTVPDMQYVVKNSMNQQVQAPDTDGTYRLANGDYDLIFDAPGYMSQAIRFHIEGAPYTLEVPVVPAFKVTFITEPFIEYQYGEVYAYNDGLSLSAHDGVIYLPEGIYTAVYNGSTYAGMIVFTITDADMTVTIPCELVYEITISSTVEGALTDATVLFSGNGEVIVVSYDGSMISLPQGTYVYQYLKVGYQDIEGSLEVNGPTSLVLSPVALNKVRYIYPPELNDLISLTTYTQDGEYRGNQAEIYLDAGNYYVLYSAEGYQSGRYDFLVSKDEDIVLSPTPLNYGKLTLTISPPEAAQDCSVYLYGNDSYYYLADDGSVDLPYGDYQLRYEKTGYMVIDIIITIDEAQESLTIYPQLTHEVQFIPSVEGAFLFYYQLVTGAHISYVEKQTYLVDGSYQVLVSSPDIVENVVVDFVVSGQDTIVDIPVTLKPQATVTVTASDLSMIENSYSIMNEYYGPITPIGENTYQLTIGYTYLLYFSHAPYQSVWMDILVTSPEQTVTIPLTERVAVRFTQTDNLGQVRLFDEQNVLLQQSTLPMYFELEKGKTYLYTYIVQGYQPVNGQFVAVDGLEINLDYLPEVKTYNLTFETESMDMTDASLRVYNYVNEVVYSSQGPGIVNLPAGYYVYYFYKPGYGLVNHGILLDQDRTVQIPLEKTYTLTIEFSGDHGPMNFIGLYNEVDEPIQLGFNTFQARPGMYTVVLITNEKVYEFEIEMPAQDHLITLAIPEVEKTEVTLNFTTPGTENAKAYIIKDNVNAGGFTQGAGVLSLDKHSAYKLVASCPGFKTKTVYFIATPGKVLDISLEVGLSMVDVYFEGSTFTIPINTSLRDNGFELRYGIDRYVNEFGTLYKYLVGYTDIANSETPNFTYLTLVTANTSVYPVWQYVNVPGESKVVLFSGTPDTVPPQFITTGEKATAPAPPIWEGYHFRGWMLNEVLFDFSQPITEDIQLFADWQEVQLHTVSFESNGGSYIEPIQAYTGNTLDLETEPTKDHYTFAGWYLDSDLTQGFDLNQAITRDLLLYAKWNICSYTVSFDSQGGSELDPVQAEYNITIDPPSDPTRTGYTFVGWYKDLTFDQAWDFTSELIIGDLTLYAKWNANSYTVSFDSQGGSAVTSMQAYYDTLIEAPVEPTLMDHTFGGWYKDASCLEAWEFSIDHVRADITLYAKWTRNEVDVEIDIVPGGTNTVTLRSKGQLSIAILGSATFDAKQIDTTSVRIGTVTLAQKKGIPQASLKDVNQDGFLDVVCKFNLTDLIIAGELTTTTNQLTVKGNMILDGPGFTGTGSITVVRGK